MLRTIQKRHRDSQRLPCVRQCSRCGGELYPGDGWWRLGSGIFCEACLVPWLLEELAPFREGRGEAER